MRLRGLFIINGISAAAGKEKAAETIAVEATLEADLSSSVESVFTITNANAYHIPLVLRIFFIPTTTKQPVKIVIIPIY